MYIHFLPRELVPGGDAPNHFRSL